MPTKTSPPVPSAAEILREIDLVAALRALAKAESEEFITRADAGKLLGVGVRTIDKYCVRIDKYCVRGLLVPLRVPTSRLTRFRKRDVLELLQPIK
jgi:hypothetical protein